MAYNIDWIIPSLRNPGRLWYCCSTITVAVVGLFSKIIVVWLNKTTVYNRQRIERALSRHPGTPLLTVSNHHSCFDDPGIWALLPPKVLCVSRRMRWSLAAHDICFTNSLHSYFFLFGKCVPIIRGAGVYQGAMDFCVERLNKGEWVHIFPEGKVNTSKQFMRFKWGIGRLVMDSVRTPLVLPIWHEGMDSVLPNAEPYILRYRKRVFFNVGEPIQVEDLLDRLRSGACGVEETRRAITERIQAELWRLGHQTRELVRKALPTALCREVLEPHEGPHSDRDS